jgi:glycosyltransferase involved in cell wall biosynthesis
MKILTIINAFPPAWQAGGPVRATYEICRELVKRNHEVVVYTTDVYSRHLWSEYEENPTVMEGISVYRFKNLSDALARKNMPIALGMMSSLEKSMREFDIVHAHLYRCFQAVQVHHYAKKYGVPYILQAHGSLPRIGAWPRLKWFYDVLFGHRLLKDAAKVIALSRVEAEQYKRMSVPEEKIAIIPNGIDLSEYANLPPKGAFKKKFNIPEDRKIILYLGRIHKIKGIDILIKAYAYMRNKMNLRDIVLVIAGPDDGYLNEAKRLAQALDVSNHVLFTGPLYGEDKMAAYIDSEAYVLPSRYETFPMTILEVYACGKPVIASEVGGLRDLVKNGETGLLFKPENVKQLAERISNILDDDKMAEEMGLRGRNFVEENFAIEKIIEKLEKLYEEAVKK